MCKDNIVNCQTFRSFSNIGNLFSDFFFIGRRGGEILYTSEINYGLQETKNQLWKPVFLKFRGISPECILPLKSATVCTSKHMFGRAIWDKLPECIFENFEFAWVKRVQFQNFQKSRGWFIPKIAQTKHVING